MKCRHCGHAVELPFIDLQTAPPSNAYLTKAQLSAPEKWYPLRVFTCTHCWLVQTEDYAHYDDLFAGDYAYFSSFSRSWLRHAAKYVEDMAARFGLGRESLLVEVAANDGYLLKNALAMGIPCLGIEPTASTAAAARGLGLEIVEEFFGTRLASQLVAQGRPADLTAANNVLAHVPDINDFVAGFALLLKPTGVATFEFPHLLRLVEQCQFDTVYHEHFSYLSLTAVKTIFEANGLSIFDVEELTTHGGSLRVFAQRSNGTRPVLESVDQMLKLEVEAGMKSPPYYTHLQERADRIKDDMLEFLIRSKRDGRSVAAYGAAAKGNTLLNYAGVRANLLPWVVDRNPAKQSKYLPGSRIPIVDEDHLIRSQPDYIAVLPWNLKIEVLDQLGYARKWGAKFVTFVPSLAIL